MKQKDFEIFIKLLDVAEIEGAIEFTSSDTMRLAIRKALVTEKENALRDMGVIDLRESLKYCSIVYGKSIKYYDVVCIIEDFLRGEDRIFVKDFSDSLSWILAIKLALGYIEKKGTILSHFSTKDFNNAEAIKRMIAKGINLELVGNGHINFKTEDRIFLEYLKEMENIIKKIGAKNVIKDILSKRIKFSEKYEIYFSHRQLSQLDDKRPPSIPFQYLLNLSYKNLGEEENGYSCYDKNREKLFNTLYEMARDLGAMYEVEPYTIFEILPAHVHAEKFHNLLMNRIFFDVMFILRQANYRHFLGLIFFILKRYDNIFISKFNLNNYEIKEILSYIFNKEGRLFIDIDGASVSAATGIKKDLINNFLSYISINVGRINENFLTPLDYTNINFFKYPLVSYGGDRFVLIDKYLCVVNAFDAIMKPIRKEIKNVDDEIGFDIEDFLREELRKKNFEFLYGKFYHKNIDGEVDICLASKSRVCIFEVKKKSLTNKSKSGFFEDAVIDISESLISSQIQTLKLENVLLEKNEVEIQGKNLRLLNRRIDRFSIAFSNFFSMHSRSFVHEYLSAMARFQFYPYPEREELKEKMDNINSLNKELSAQLLKKKEILSSTHFQELVFNSSFLNFYQFMFFLEESNNLEEFLDNLNSTNHIRFGTDDAIVEYIHYSNMKKMQ